GARPRAGRPVVAKASTKPASSGKGPARPAPSAPPAPKLKFRGRMLENEPLAASTTYRIGGPARFLVTPDDADDVAKALHLAQDRGMPWLGLGLGSYVLVAAGVIPGVELLVG